MYFIYFEKFVMEILLQKSCFENYVLKIMLQKKIYRIGSLEVTFKG